MMSDGNLTDKYVGSCLATIHEFGHSCRAAVGHQGQ